MLVRSSVQPVNNWDKAGMVVSGLCLIHCMLTPLAFFALPAAAHVVEDLEWIHLFFACLAIPVSGYALTTGYKRHGSKLPLLLSAFGIALLWIALFIHEPHWLESTVASIGAAFLGVGHLNNHRMTCRCCSGT